MGLLSPLIKDYLRPELRDIKGVLLDIGCGDLPYRELCNNVDKYVGLDREVRFRPQENFDVIFGIGNATELPFKMDSFDTILSTQVIEHLSQPLFFFKECYRVLKPGGTGIMTFPLVNPLHELPDDYWRYTEYGLRQLCLLCGLKVEKVKPMGGGWTTLGFILYYFLYSRGERQASDRVKSIFHLAGRWFFSIMQYLDKHWPYPELPVNYMVILRK